MRTSLISVSAILIFGIILNSCISKNTKSEKEMEILKKGTYGFDKQFLSKYLNLIELRNGEAAIIIIPDFQARVMTSACQGDEGFSFGWINYDLIESQKEVEHFNPYGGEERFWLGPEGGQFSVYFEKDKEFVFNNWYVPPAIDTEEFHLVEQEDMKASFKKSMQLTNYSGTQFSLDVQRSLKLLDNVMIEEYLGLHKTEASAVSYESSNTITNTGDKQWKDESGLLSIWMLSMLIPSPEVTVFIPVKEGDEDQLGPCVNDNYFGKVSEDRLKLIDNIIFFKADGKSRGKIGIPPLRATRFAGSYDAQNNALTILECILPQNNSKYVNSAWELQEDPYSGDAINSYNDGPLEDGSQMGPFYELETSSPALSLHPDESYTHLQRTYHFIGTRKELDEIVKTVMNISIDDIESAFKN